jgi:hypothetical protein
MNGAKYHADQGYYYQHYIQQAENGLTVIFFQLKKAKGNNKQEQGVRNYYLAAQYIIQNVSG